LDLYDAAQYSHWIVDTYREHSPDPAIVTSNKMKRPREKTKHMKYGINGEGV
jgi:hypothetical protein